MQPTSPIADRKTLDIVQDDTRPAVFLDTRYDNCDDLGDWWMDLGRIDLPA